MSAFAAVRVATAQVAFPVLIFFDVHRGTAATADEQIQIAGASSAPLSPVGPTRCLRYRLNCVPGFPVNDLRQYITLHGAIFCNAIPNVRWIFENRLTAGGDHCLPCRDGMPSLFN